MQHIPNGNTKQKGEQDKAEQRYLKHAPEQDINFRTVAILVKDDGKKDNNNEDGNRLRFYILHS